MMCRDDWQKYRPINERDPDGVYNPLLARVANNLVGRSCRVYVRAPMVKRAGGTASLLDGIPTVEISPTSTVEYVLHTLTHEAAHLRCGHCKVRQPKTAPGSIPFSRPASAPTYNQHESEADRLADRWQRYAKRYQHLYRGDWLTRRLLALSDWTIGGDYR